MCNGDHIETLKCCCIVVVWLCDSKCEAVWGVPTSPGGVNDYSVQCAHQKPAGSRGCERYYILQYYTIVYYITILYYYIYTILYTIYYSKKPRGH